jgi:hypothetical protein
MIRMKKIDIIRDKKINLHGLHLYFSIIEFSELFFNRENDVISGGVTCLHVERIHH